MLKKIMTILVVAMVIGGVYITFSSMTPRTNPFTSGDEVPDIYVLNGNPKESENSSLCITKLDPWIENVELEMDESKPVVETVDLMMDANEKAQFEIIKLNVENSKPVETQVEFKNDVKVEKESEKKTEKVNADNWIVELTQDELESFYKLVYAEDGIENEERQLAVAATILNRMLSDKFPNDFYGVMNQSGAFSSVRNGVIYIMTNNPFQVTLDMIPDSTKSAVHRALQGEDPTEVALREEATRLGVNAEEFASDGALFFYNPNACGPKALEQRASIQVKSQLGYHYFYKIWG